jgi:hypothetical protein
MAPATPSARGASRRETQLFLTREAPARHHRRLTVSESFFNATQSRRFGLALIAMYVLLLALTALYWMRRRSWALWGWLGI